MKTIFPSPATIKRLVKSSLPIRRSKNWWRIKRKLSGLAGLEIGGPSPYFEAHHLCPAYAVLSTLDHCNIVKSNFSQEGSFLLDATNLHGLKNQQYGAVLSSHVLEHIANPIKALKEWRRVLKPSGLLLLILPYRDHIFDHRRDITRFEHLLEDFQKDVSESDLSHLPEILEKHDLGLDPIAGDLDNFRKRSLDNLANRCLHHHVFDRSLIRETLGFCGFQILLSETIDPYSSLILARR
jgi:SAM-dependent methyltransferase